jgi:hypothetical protein
MTTAVQQLTETEYDAALARLRDWADQIANAEADADRGSLDRAADLREVFESKRWVADLPPVKSLAKRRMRRDTQKEFVRWTKLNPDKIGRPYTQSRIARLVNAARIAGYAIGINSEGALRPLSGKFATEHFDEIPDVINRAREIADGGQVTEKIVAKALRDHNDLVRPRVKPDRPDAPVVKDRHAEEKKIRAEFKRLLDDGRRKDAGELINLLIADYKASAA